MFVPCGTATENHGAVSHWVAQVVLLSPSTQLDGAHVPGSVDVLLMAGMSIAMEQSIWLSGMGGGAGAK